jgi:hypothetical protein
LFLLRHGGAPSLLIARNWAPSSWHIAAFGTGLHAKWQPLL